MKLILNILWIGGLIMLSISVIMVLVVFFDGQFLDWGDIFTVWIISLTTIFILRFISNKLSGDDYISLWFKVLKIRFLNWKDSSRQKLEEELERNSQQDTNEAQSALDETD